MVKLHKLIKNWLPGHLPGRLLLMISLPILLVQIIVGYVFIDRYFHTELVERSHNFAEYVTLLQKWPRQQAFPEGEIHYHGASGKLSSHNPIQQEACRNSRLDQTVTDILRKKLQINVIVCAPIHKDKLYIILPWHNEWLIFTGKRKMFIDSQWHFLLVWMCVSSLILLAISLIFMRNQLRPLQKMAIAARHFEEGNFSFPLRPAGSREIRQTGQTLLDMQRKINDYIQQRTMMLAGISHDLRTILTRFSLTAALLPNSQDKSELQNDITQMQSILDHYLSYVRDTHPQQPHIVNLQEFIKKYNKKNKKMEILLKNNLPSNLLNTHINPLSLQRCCDNIVQNASRYGKKLHIITEISEHHIFLHFDDDGPGLHKNAIEYIFQPFQTFEHRNKKNDSLNGLGLTIVRDIMRNVQGNATASTNSTLGGCRITLTFPISNKK